MRHLSNVDYLERLQILLMNSQKRTIKARFPNAIPIEYEQSEGDEASPSLELRQMWERRGYEAVRDFFQENLEKFL